MKLTVIEEVKQNNVFGNLLNNRSMESMERFFLPSSEYPSPKPCRKLDSTALPIDKYGDRILIFFAIISGPRYEDRRDAMRETWLTDSMTSSRTSYRFFLPKPAPEDKESIIEEMEQHGDMVILDLPASYDHILIQSIAGLLYGAEECGSL